MLIRTLLSYSVKTTIGVIVAGIIAIISMANVHVIKDTEVGVFVKVGKIQPQVATTGIAFTIPFIEELRLIDTTEQKLSFDDITLATEADAASPAIGNIVITYVINGEEAPIILEQFGTITRFIDARLTQLMFSEARILASDVRNTRLLMLPATRIALGQDLRKTLESSHSGYSVRNVMVQSIFPHATIAKRINDAAQRDEDDVIEQANIKLATSKAATSEAKARGLETVANAQARARAYEVTAQADAEAHAILSKANAKRDGMIAIAAGNKALDTSLTPSILEDKRIAVNHELATHSVGMVPATVIGETDLRSYGVPMMALK